MPPAAPPAAAAAAAATAGTATPLPAAPRRSASIAPRSAVSLGTAQYRIASAIKASKRSAYPSRGMDKICEGERVKFVRRIRIQKKVSKHTHLRRHDAAAGAVDCALEGELSVFALIKGHEVINDRDLIEFFADEEPPPPVKGHAPARAFALALAARQGHAVRAQRCASAAPRSPNRVVARGTHRCSRMDGAEHALAREHSDERRVVHNAVLFKC